MKNLYKKSVIGAGIVVAGTFFLVACTSTTPSTDAQQGNAQNTTAQIENAATHAVPYPINQMEQGGWTEEQLLREHLLRQNDPNAVRYVTWLTMNGQVIATWTIKGMVFDPNSQMTNTQQVTYCSNANGGGACSVTEAPGDNGTYGPEAGAAAFFTTNDTEVQLPPGALWVESDSPLNITTTPLITYDLNQTPNDNQGGLTKIGSVSH
jgi:hypothetical protein